jgi:hypothetical protein
LASDIVVLLPIPPEYGYVPVPVTPGWVTATCRTVKVRQALPGLYRR